MEEATPIDSILALFQVDSFLDFAVLAAAGIIGLALSVKAIQVAKRMIRPV